MNAGGSKSSKFTAAGEIANERLVEAAADPDRYPEGTAFIGVDQEQFGAIVADAVAEHRPLAIIYPDGLEIVAAPGGGVLAVFERLLTRRREVPGAVQIPTGYRVQIRDRRTLAAA